jgi:SmpA / OmlA family
METLTRRWRGLVFVLLSVLLFAGCDPQRIDELEEGVATEADVRARFGEPTAVYPEADGARTFEYPRQPAGHRNYMITIGADGRMSALRQVLKPEEFAKVRVGLDQAQVRRLLGRPAATQAYPLKQQEAWDWRYLEGTDSRLFTVTFDAQGQVVETGSRADPQTQGGG